MAWSGKNARRWAPMVMAMAVPVAGIATAPGAHAAAPAAHAAPAPSDYAVSGSPAWIVNGPDNSLWFTESDRPFLGRANPAGKIAQLPLPSGVVATGHLAVGPGGNLWVEEQHAGGGWYVAQVKPNGQVVRQSAVSGPGWVTSGGDGSSVWVSEAGRYVARIGVDGSVSQVISTAGVTTGLASSSIGELWVAEAKVNRVARLEEPGGREIGSYPLPAGADPQGVTLGPDGALWVAEPGIDAVAKIVPTFDSDAYVVQVPLPAGARPDAIAVGPDGNLWVSETGRNALARVGIHGTVTQYPIPAGTHPRGVTFGPKSQVWFADTGHVGSFASGAAATGTITTVAGNDSQGATGDGGAAVAAALGSPFAVAVDPAGDLYVADEPNNRIRRVTPGGVITTVAGTGTAGYSGDGGKATSAELDFPTGVAVDGAGNLYVADSQNNRVRKITTSGIITTVAGTGAAGYSGDGGKASAAELDAPFSVAVDNAGNLYVADSQNNRVRKVSPSGTITTVAGNGTSGYSGDGGKATGAELAGPLGVAAGSDHRIYIADSFNQRVRVVNSSGIISTVAGDGTPGDRGDGGRATGAELGRPQGLAVDASGNLYVADSRNNDVRQVTSAGTITTFAGAGTFPSLGDWGPARQAFLNAPSGVAVGAGGDVFIADTDNGRIRLVTPTS